MLLSLWDMSHEVLYLENPRVDLVLAMTEIRRIPCALALYSTYPYLLTAEE